MSRVISTLQRVKDVDGSYIITLPINTIEDVYVNLDTGETLVDLMNFVVGGVNDNKASIVEDMATVLSKIAGLIDDNLSLNHIHRENFKTDSNLIVTQGTFESGSVRAGNNQSYDFKFKNPVELKSKPEKFKLQHVIKYVGSPTLSCEITFNAKDSSPQWFDCASVLASNIYALVPAITNKEQGVPYAINIRLYGNCDTSSTFEASDLTIINV